MKTLLIALTLAMPITAMAADTTTPAEKKAPFDWRDVVGMTKDEAVKAATTAGWKVVAVDTWLMKAEPSKERTLYLCVNKDGRVTGVLVSPAE
jgi:purine nucleoside phosphorylase